MELTKKQIDITKGVAILFMLILHLFCRKEFDGLYEPLIMLGEIPLIYYLALFGDCCVAIYCFCSGYGLFIGYINNKEEYFKKNLIRILKLYINYWIILIIFVLGLGYIMGKSDVFPENLNKFLLNFTAIVPSYNGAWWFLTTYIVLVLTSPIINRVVIKYNSILVLVVSFIIYFISYIQRIKGVLVFENPIVHEFVKQLALLGTSLLPFIIGAIFANERLYSKIYIEFERIKFKNAIAILLILAMILIHSIIETLFIAVFTGVGFIVLFNIIDKPKLIENILIYISRHSTNMWLTHMFFYGIFFKKIVFAPKYPVLIFIWLLMICIASSNIINIIYRLIINVIDDKIRKKLKVV